MGCDIRVVVGRDRRERGDHVESRLLRRYRGECVDDDAKRYLEPRRFRRRDESIAKRAAGDSNATHDRACEGDGCHWITQVR